MKFLTVKEALQTEDSNDWRKASQNNKLFWPILNSFEIPFPYFQRIKIPFLFF